MIPTDHEHYPDTHHDIYSKTLFGFWVYLLTDFILFGTFFATYAVLQGNLFGGPSGRQLLNLPFALAQSLVLLMASFTSGMGGAFAHRKNKKWTMITFLITLLLGIAFMWMELSELTRLWREGVSWKQNGFLSAFFTLIGTHGLHMIFAMLWTILLLIPLFYEEEISSVSIRRLTCLRMFWQFLSIIWGFIFTIIYFRGEL